MVIVGYGILTNHDRDHCFVDLQVNVLFYSFWEGNVIFLTAPNQVELQNSEEHRIYVVELLLFYYDILEKFLYPSAGPDSYGGKSVLKYVDVSLGDIHL